MSVADSMTVARFMQMVHKSESGCWLWKAAVTKRGYGVIKHGLAHRKSWEIHNGPIPDGLFVCHKCDVRDCVNPDHLFLGTNQDNVTDREKKGRGNQAKGERSINSKLHRLQVMAIRYRREVLGETVESLGKRYGIAHPNISQVCLYRTWKHLRFPNCQEWWNPVVPADVFAPKKLERSVSTVRFQGMIGANNHRSKLNEQQAGEIKARVANGEKQSALAIEYNVSTTTVNQIVKGRVWARALVEGAHS